MNPPRVSVGMPVYNGARYLRGAVEAFLAQTFGDFELIISDNASTDRTAAIAQELAARDPRIRLIRQERNIGAVANFAFVLGEARGEFFQWAAHDDLWRPFWLERAVAALDADPEAGFAFPSFELLDPLTLLRDRYDPAIFAFVEKPDRRSRLLDFAALHTSSHKCNLVYALGRTGMMRAAHARQDISNDVILSMALTSLAYGVVINQWPFIKRNWFVLSRLKSRIGESRRRTEKRQTAINATIARSKELFPELQTTLADIFLAERPGIQPKGHITHNTRVADNGAHPDRRDHCSQTKG